MKNKNTPGGRKRVDRCKHKVPVDTHCRQCFTEQKFRLTKPARSASHNATPTLDASQPTPQPLDAQQVTDARQAAANDEYNHSLDDPNEKHLI